MIEWQDTVSTWVLSYAPRAAMGAARAITVSDLVACLKANPEVRDTVLRELAPRKARAEMAERELAALHALIHDQSGLDDHEYTPGQMVAEMAARWQGASDDLEKLEDTICEAGGGANTVADALMWIDRARRERDEARAERDEALSRACDACPAQGCELATVHLCERHSELVARCPECGSYEQEPLADGYRCRRCSFAWHGWEWEDAEEQRMLRSRIAKLEAVVEAMPRCGHRFGCDKRSMRSDGYTSFCDEHGAGWTLLPWSEALRALDAQDSGGSGEHEPK